MAVAPDGSRVYVGNAYSSNISVIDTADRTVSTVATDGGVWDIALSPDGAQLFTALLLSGLDRISTNDLQVHRIATPACPAYLAMTRDGKRLYVGYQCGGPGGTRGHDAIGIFNPSSGTFDTPITGLAMVGSPLSPSPDGAQLWASAGDACSGVQYDHRDCLQAHVGIVDVINAGDHGLLKQIVVSAKNAKLERISFFPDGGHVLVGGTENLLVVDATRMSVIASLPFRGSGSVVFANANRQAFIPLWEKNAVVVEDLASPACSPPGDRLTGSWPGDGVANDASGFADAEVNGGVTYAPGRVGQAFSLDGQTGAVAMAYDSHNHPGWPSTSSVALWVKFRDDGKSGAFARDIPVFDQTTGDHDTLRRWQLFKTSGNRFALCLIDTDGRGCEVGRPTRLESSTIVRPDTWYHLAAVDALNGDIALFVDGIRESSRSTAIHPPGPGSRLVLGSDAARGVFLNGLIDEVFLYQRALTDAEVASLFHMPACLSTARNP